jgi:hypothetical protein
MIVDGAWVPVIAIGILATVWLIILYGSTFFGPR